jgi:ABC-type uncharacterized transport system substrate-binding protein
MSYRASLTADFQRAGVLVGKILHGSRPSDIPVEEPAKLELGDQPQDWQSLGLTIPASRLARADQMIEWAVERHRREMGQFR